jgi:hypothetical protein
MVFIEEGWRLEDAGMNVMWLEQCFGTKWLSIKSNETICAGTIFGPPEQFFKFAELLLSKWPLPDCWWDQPIVNYLLHTGEFAKIGIQARSFGCDGPVLTLSNCGHRVKTIHGVPEGLNELSQIPYVAHQWKAFDDFRDMYLERCDMSNHMQKLQKLSPVDLNWTAPERW